VGIDKYIDIEMVRTAQSVNESEGDLFSENKLNKGQKKLEDQIYWETLPRFYHCRQESAPKKGPASWEGNKM